jgi:hypothetical protein
MRVGAGESAQIATFAEADTGDKEAHWHARRRGAAWRLGGKNDKRTRHQRQRSAGK